MRKKKTMTMTKISSKKTCYTYGHGPLKICAPEEKNDDYDQDSLEKDLVRIWSWSSDFSFSPETPVNGCLDRNSNRGLRDACEQCDPLWDRKTPWNPK